MRILLVVVLSLAACVRRESSSAPVEAQSDAATPTRLLASAAEPVLALATVPRAIPGLLADLRRSDAGTFTVGFWPQPNPDSRWTNAKHVEIQLSARINGASILILTGSGFIVPGKLEKQRVIVSVNGKSIGSFEVTDGGMRGYSLKVPAGVWNGAGHMTLDLPDADSPLHLGEGGDDRVLALALQSVEIRPGG